MTPKQTSALYAIALAAAIAFVYSFSLNNQLLFDDARLTDATVFGQYGSLLLLKVRTLSYGSFVWVQANFGEGWWKQRAVNVVLHIGVALTLYALVLELLKVTRWPDETRRQPKFFAGLQTSARLAVALWSLNPMAVYAVAYLIQRSILMATLFVALALLGFVRGLASGRLQWFLACAVCYLLAVLSKEHAVTSVLLLVPLYVFVKRPPAGQVLRVTAVTALVLGGAGLVLYSRYSSILGTVFDETSRAFVVQLEQQQPGISQNIFPLSIINQASLFFQYGFLWLAPIVGWMSIDIRPAFPLALQSWQLAGALAWLATLALGAWLVWRRSDALGLLGLCLLIPALMFVTEFATVWVQDPFVLYRSYLWSIAIPVLLALALLWLAHNGFAGGPFVGVCLIVVAAFAAFSFERISSLQTPSVAWQDASAKINQQAPPNAVGRWRPFLNLGAEALDKEDYAQALRWSNQAETLGEPLGAARFNMGVSLQQLKKHTDALENFAAAESKGFTEAALYYQRGESQYALARFAEAFDSFSKSLSHRQTTEAEEFTRLRQAEAAVASQKYDTAIASYQLLVKQNPDKQRYQVGLSMAYIGKKDYPAAMDILNPAIAQRPTGAAHYARALAHFYMGKRDASLQDLQIALRAEPNNPVYAQLQQMLNPPAAKPAAKP